MKIFYWLVCIGFYCSTFSISFFVNSADLIEKGQISIGKVFVIRSEVLKEDREIYISLPSNYKHSNFKYPIVIVLDGEYLFNVTTAIIEHQSSRNYIPESIVIGVPNNTGKRLNMALELFNSKKEPFFYADTLGQSKTYLKFIRNELLPALSSQYRINDHRTIIGLSPTFGPVLESFWHQPDLFSGYIVLAAELGKYLKNGEAVADKIVNSIKDQTRQKMAIYIGTSSKDIKKRGLQEGELYNNTANKLVNSANPKINYKFEIIPNEDHYGMAISGIQNGLETIFPRNQWNIDYRTFWKNEYPAKALKSAYEKLSNEYGFNVVPIEKSFYSVNSLYKVAEILERQERYSELKGWVSLAMTYYPHSPELKKIVDRLEQKSSLSIGD